MITLRQENHKTKSDKLAISVSRFFRYLDNSGIRLHS